MVNNSAGTDSAKCDAVNFVIGGNGSSTMPDANVRKAARVILGLESSVAVT